MSLSRICFCLLMLLPIMAHADVVQPDIRRDTATFRFIARGTFKEVIEPVYTVGCDKRNQYGQCETAYRMLPTNIQRMLFEADEIYYINPSNFISQETPIVQRSRTYLDGLPATVIVVARPDMLGKRGLLASYEKFNMVDAISSGDFSGDLFWPENDPNYNNELNKAKALYNPVKGTSDRPFKRP